MGRFKPDSIKKYEGTSRLTNSFQHWEEYFHSDNSNLKHVMDSFKDILVSMWLVFQVSFRFLPKFLFFLPPFPYNPDLFLFIPTRKNPQICTALYHVKNPTQKPYSTHWKYQLSSPYTTDRELQIFKINISIFMLCLFLK